MALQNGGTDANGVVALNNVAGMDQYVTFGGRTLPPDEIAITTSFNSMQAAIANVSPIPPLGAPGDDGANITAALAKNAPVVLQKGATYNIATPIVMSATPGATLYGNGATLTGAMARTGGIANSVILAQPTLSGAGNTTLNGNAVIGARTLTVTAGAGIANNTFIQVQSAAGASLTAYYLVIAGGTTNTLTLDRPIQEPFLNADTVKPVSVMPRSCNVIGPLTINGNGDNALSWAGMRRGYMRDVYADVQNAASGATCLVGGLDLDVGCFAVLAEDCQASGFNLVANADVFVISMGMASCESCRFVRCAGRHATTAGILITGSFSCTLDHCEGTDCTGVGAVGIAFAGTTATGATCTDCVATSCYSGDNATGYSIGTATRITLRNCAGENSATIAVSIAPGGTVSTDCLLDAFRHLGGACATVGIIAAPTAVRPAFTNLLCTNQTGTADNVQIACNDAIISGAVLTNLLGIGIHLVTAAAGAVYLTNIQTTRASTGGAMATIKNDRTGGQVYVKNAEIAVGVASDLGIWQSSNDVVEIDDVIVTNPNAVGTTFGFFANGATSVTRRKGRNDFSATNTPYTLVQSDQGTFTSNNNVAVDVTFKDIRAAAFLGITLFTPGGTPAFGHTLTITAATKFTFTGTNLDTSTYEYKILD